jgi:hypothetical protein
LGGWQENVGCRDRPSPISNYRQPFRRLQKPNKLGPEKAVFPFHPGDKHVREFHNNIASRSLGDRRLHHAEDPRKSPLDTGELSEE